MPDGPDSSQAKFTALLRFRSEDSPAKTFVEEKPVHDLFAKILRDEPFFLPINVHRVEPPAAQDNGVRFIHQDAFYSDGIPFNNSWISLAPIDEQVGGLAVAEGMQKQGNLHHLGKPPRFDIPPEVVPYTAWRRINYEPGADLYQRFQSRIS
jgi:hypothetical protein